MFPGQIHYLDFRSPECPLKVRVIANSPSLWPTMFSEISTGTCWRPLCTAIVNPTMSGMIIERRDQVLIGRRSLVATAFSTFFNKCRSTNGPFLIERGMCSSDCSAPLPDAGPWNLPTSLLLAAANDHRLRPLVLPRLVTLRRHAPRRNRMAAARRPALAAAVRMVDRVHRDTAHGRPDAAPALRARLAELAQVVLVVPDLADRRATVHVHLTHLARAEPDGHVGPLAGDDLRGGAGAARKLGALAGLQLHAVHLRADRNVLERQRVARLDRRIGARLDRVADGNPLRREDVPPLAVLIHDERQVRAAVRIVLEPLDPAGDTVLVAPEIDDPVMPAVTAAAMPRRDPALIVAAARLRQRHDERLVRRPLVQLVVDDAHREALTGGRGFELA